MLRAERKQRRQRRRQLRQVPRDHIKARRRRKVMGRVVMVIDSLSDVQALLLENVLKDVKPIWGIDPLSADEGLRQLPRHDATRECPVCEVRGDWAKCRTKSGNNAKKPHKGRFTEEEMASWEV